LPSVLWFLSWLLLSCRGRNVVTIASQTWIHHLMLILCSANSFKTPNMSVGSQAKISFYPEESWWAWVPIL
jgi:hypothetical protein